MPKLPSKWHCSGNYDDNNSSCDQWDNTSNYKHDISWRNNGDHVLQLAVMMSFVNRIIRKCMGQWQCSWGQIRISDETKQANNRLSCCYCCRVEPRLMFNDNMTKRLISEGNSHKYFTWKGAASFLRLSVSVCIKRSFCHWSPWIAV